MKEINLNLDLIFQDYFYLLHYFNNLVQKEITFYHKDSIKATLNSIEVSKLNLKLLEQVSFVWLKQTLELYVLVNNAFISSFDKSFN